jgi:hypothetical protein
MKAIDVCKGIVDKNGWEYQYNVAMEELAELIKELSKAKRYKGSQARICEEIADVEVCIMQIKLTIPQAQEQVNIFKRFKLERLQKLYIEGSEK